MSLYLFVVNVHFPCNFIKAVNSGMEEQLFPQSLLKTESYREEWRNTLCAVAVSFTHNNNKWFHNDNQIYNIYSRSSNVAASEFSLSL